MAAAAALIGPPVRRPIRQLPPGVQNEELGQGLPTAGEQPMPQPQPQAPLAQPMIGPTSALPLARDPQRLLAKQNALAAGPGSPAAQPMIGPAAQAQPTAVVASGQQPVLQQGQGPGPVTGDDLLTEITAKDTLRNQQINPAATQRERSVAGETDVARGELSTGPSREDLAQRYLTQFEQAGEPAYQARLRDVGRRASALGRLGAGMTTSELGDLSIAREQELARGRERAAIETAGQGIEDRYRRFGTLAGEESRLFGVGGARREELRGERGYQQGLAQQAQEDRIRQRMLEEDLVDRAFGRSAQRAGLGLAGAGDIGAEAEGTQQAAADVLQQLAMERGLTGRGGNTGSPAAVAPSTSGSYTPGIGGGLGGTRGLSAGYTGLPPLQNVPRGRTARTTATSRRAPSSPRPQNVPRGRTARPRGR